MSYHQTGGEPIWQIRTGCYGCPNADGGFEIRRFCDALQSNPIRAIEVKLSLGVNPDVITLGKELIQLSRACGLSHPSTVSLDHFEILDDAFGAKSAKEVFG